MKKRKHDQAQVLLEAMGNIDDAYLNEALSYVPTKGKKLKILRSPAMRALSTTAALAAVLALVILSPLRGVLNNAFNDDAAEKLPDHAESAPDISPAALDQLLQACTESPSFQAIAADEVPFFDGNVRLTVQRLDSGAIYTSRPLTDQEQSRLRREMELADTEISDEEFDERQYAVWITLGDGTVATPYLTPSPGNLGAAELFRYETERLPSQLFFILLEDLI